MWFRLVLRCDESRHDPIRLGFVVCSLTTNQLPESRASTTVSAAAREAVATRFDEHLLLSSAPLVARSSRIAPIPSLFSSSLDTDRRKAIFQSGNDYLVLSKFGDDHFHIRKIISFRVYFCVGSVIVSTKFSNC